MDFGEILDKWENKHGTYDKDGAGEDVRSNTAEAAERRRRLRAKKPDVELDIHGLTRNEAWEALEKFFASAKEQGLEKVLVIHGKGNHSSGDAVLKRVVREFIEHCPDAGESGQGQSAGQGGSGATWIILKNTNVPGR